MVHRHPLQMHGICLCDSQTHPVPLQACLESMQLPTDNHVKLRSPLFLTVRVSLLSAVQLQN